MASMNPFDLLGTNENEDPEVIASSAAAKPAVAKPAAPKADAKPAAKCECCICLHQICIAGGQRRVGGSWQSAADAPSMLLLLWHVSPGACGC